MIYGESGTCPRVSRSTRSIASAASTSVALGERHRPDRLAGEEALHDRSHRSRDQQLRHHHEDVEQPHINAELLLRQARGEDRIGHCEDRRPGNADPDFAEQQPVPVRHHEEAGIARRAAQQPDDMRPCLADPRGEEGQERQRGDGGDAVIGGEQRIDPVRALLIERVGGIGGAVEDLRHDRRGVDPHDEQGRPAEELRDREPLHQQRHARKVADDAAQHVGGRTRAGERDRRGAGEAVAEQQCAEQIDFLLQPELRHRPERPARPRPARPRWRHNRARQACCRRPHPVRQGCRMPPWRRAHIRAS